jgi:hypothetical protein
MLCSDDVYKVLELKMAVYQVVIITLHVKQVKLLACLLSSANPTPTACHTAATSPSAHEV